jgi:hypothetical protein
MPALPGSPSDSHRRLAAGRATVHFLKHASEFQVEPFRLGGVISLAGVIVHVDLTIRAFHLFVLCHTTLVSALLSSQPRKIPATLPFLRFHLFAIIAVFLACAILGYGRYPQSG